MMVNGEWTNAKVKDMKLLEMEVSIKDSMFRTKCKVKVNMCGPMVRYTKESGITT